MSVQTPPSHAPRAVAIWLFALCAMVFAMVVLGGVTRLTGSGLSMVEWRPLLGWLPPGSEAEWAALFERYKAFPEYGRVNAGMTLDGFKSIFWLEYMHRLWGRLIGVAFLLPFIFFLITRRVPPGMTPALVAIFLLGAVQGGLGWFMVQSGLVDRPQVSQYRLAAHLLLALALYAAMFWLALSLVGGRAGDERGLVLRSFRRLALVPLILIATTVASGAFVAGLDAGLIHNTFPMMGGRWIPAEAYAGPSLVADLFEDPTTVQFNHRLLAMATAVAVVALWTTSRFLRLPLRLRAACSVMLLALALQVALGISTLLAFVPVWLAALHQAGAVLLLTAGLWVLHAAARGGATGAEPIAAAPSSA